jgi:hypothetical protein
VGWTIVVPHIERSLSHAAKCLEPRDVVRISGIDVEDIMECDVWWLMDAVEDRVQPFDYILIARYSPMHAGRIWGTWQGIPHPFVHLCMGKS